MNDDNIIADNSTEPEDAHSQSDFADEEWMTIDQVAEYFGCPASRVREWIANGVLTPQASGSIERIQRSELDRVRNPDQDAAHEFEKDHGS